MSEVPRGWVQTTLGDIVATRSGNSTLIKGKLSSVPGRGLFPAFSASGQDVWCSDAEYQGDGIVLSAVGARCGKAFLAHGAWTAIANTHVIIPAGGIATRFLWYLLNDETFWIRSGSAQSFVKVKASLQTTLALPPFNEQRRIVAAIEEQFSRIDAAKASLALATPRLDALRRVLLREAFRGPWPVAPLEEATDPARPICYGILKPKTVGDLEVPYVEVRSIRQGRVDVESLHRTTRAMHEEFRRSELRAGDVVLAIRGSYDRAAVIPLSLDGANVSRDVARIAPLPALNATYLAHYLAGPAAFTYFERAARGVAVRGVNIGDLRKMQIPLPPLGEQRRIVARVEAQISAIDALRAAIERSERRSASLRRTILRRAFRGELVPQDPSDEPASASLERIRAGGREMAPSHPRRRTVGA